MSIKIDPIFDLPEGLNGLEYKDEEFQLPDTSVDDYEGTSLDDDESSSSVDVVVPPALSGDDEPLLPPDNCTVVSQNVRVDADGSTVVDVIVELDGSDGVTQYDVKVSAR